MLHFLHLLRFLCMSLIFFLNTLTQLSYISAIFLDTPTQQNLLFPFSLSPIAIHLETMYKPISQSMLLVPQTPTKSLSLFYFLNNSFHHVECFFFF